MQRSLLAALAIAAVGLVAAASAAASEFHSSKSSAALDGGQEGTHKLTVQGSTATCTVAEFTGTASPTGTSSSQELHPGYSGSCTLFGLSGGSVTTTGCRFLFNANTSEFNLNSCSYIRYFVDTFFGDCEVVIPSQIGINGISYGNMSPKTTFTIQFNSTNVVYEVTLSTGVCPLTEKLGYDAQYQGLMALKAGGGAYGYWLE